MEDGPCNRKVIFKHDNEVWMKLKETKDFTEAVGYLSTWAMHNDRYAVCLLFPMANEHMGYEITASYFEKEEHIGRERPTYVIGAIYNHDDSRWSFHS